MQNDEALRSQMMNIFEHLHDNPERSWEETDTTEYVKGILKEYGYRITTFDDCTGVVGEIGHGSPVVGLRADMDALWQEVDGKLKANHSCGHDAHMTMVLGVVMGLAQMNFKPSGTFRVIFQPAEETGNGALKMVEKKVVDDVDYLYGVHLRPVQELADGEASPAIIHGAAVFIQGKIAGEDIHGARPHLGTNAIEVGAALINHFNQIHLDPSIAYSIKMTQFNTANGTPNSIPGSATFSLDLRAQTNEVMDQLMNKVDQAVEVMKQLYNVEIETEIGAAIAAATVNPAAQEMLAESIRGVLGRERLAEPVVTTGGEDFHFCTLKVPRIKATMLGLGCGLEPGLHHPKMAFNRDALLSGANILMQVIRTTFEKGEVVTDDNKSY